MNDSFFRRQQFPKSTETYPGSFLGIPEPEDPKRWNFAALKLESFIE
jgi:hypothetical protein